MSGPRAWLAARLGRFSMAILSGLSSIEPEPWAASTLLEMVSESLAPKKEHGFWRKENLDQISLPMRTCRKTPDYGLPSKRSVAALGRDAFMILIKSQRH